VTHAPVFLIVILAFFPLVAAAPAAAFTEAETAAAETPVHPTATAGREEAALALIRFPWQKLNYEIVFLGPQRGYRAMTIAREQRIEIYARPGEDSRKLAYDIAHELGHAIDLIHNTPDTRRKWKELRGIDPATPWFGCSRCSDYNTPAGDFAETFALLMLGPGQFRGRIAPPPTMEQGAALTAYFPAGLPEPAVAGPAPLAAISSVTGVR
jgi:hypothetical protein